MNDELRRLPRMNVCCRAVVRDRYGLWTAVTEDLCARGCRLLTRRLLRPGAPLLLTLSSDLFPDELETAARAAWATPELLGVAFVGGEARPGALSPEAWVEKLLEHGAPTGHSRSRVLPALVRAGPRGGPKVRSDDTVVVLPIRRS